MFEKVFSNLGLDVPPKPREIIIPPGQMKSEFRGDTGLPTDPNELVSDLGLPKTPKEAVRMLGLPALDEFSPKKLFQ